MRNFQGLAQPTKRVCRPIDFSPIRSAELDVGSVSRFHEVRGFAERGFASLNVRRPPLQVLGNGAGVVTLSFHAFYFGQMLD